MCRGIFEYSSIAINQTTPSTVLPFRRFLRIYGFSFFHRYSHERGTFSNDSSFVEKKEKRSWIGVKVEAWEERKVLEGLRLEEGGCVGMERWCQLPVPDPPERWRR